MKAQLYSSPPNQDRNREGREKIRLPNAVPIQLYCKLCERKIYYVPKGQRPKSSKGKRVGPECLKKGRPERQRRSARLQLFSLATILYRCSTLQSSHIPLFFNFIQ